MSRLGLRWLLRVLVLASMIAVPALLGSGRASKAENAAGPPQATAGRPAPSLEHELASGRTATSRTYRQPGGGMVTRLFPQAVNFRDDDGRWRQIDASLVDADQPGYLHERANDGEVLIPRNLSKPVRVARGDAWVTFALQGADGAAPVDLDDTVARFDGAAPSTRAVYEATNTGVKESLILGDASAPATFDYDVAASAGLVPSREDGGSIVFRDPAGKPVFRFGAPVVWDAGGSFGAADYALSPSASGWVLRLRVDRSWLSAAGRAFPVTVDPNVQWLTGGTMRYSGANRDCTVASGDLSSTSLCSEPTLRVGGDGTHTYKSVLWFDTPRSIEQDAVIAEATFLAHVGGSGTAAASNLRTRPVTSSWTSAATWLTRDGTTAWATPGGDVSDAAGDVSPARSVAGLNDWYHWIFPAEVVQRWVWGTQPDFGLELSADPGSPDVVYAFESTENDPYKWPAIDIWWRRYGGDQPSYTQDIQRTAAHSQLAVNVANGSLKYTTQDLALPGPTGDLPIVMDRDWNSNQSFKTAAFGYGWSHRYEHLWLRIDGDGSILFDDATGAAHRFAADGNGGYVTPPELNGSLCKIQDTGTACTRDGIAGVVYKLTDDDAGLKSYFYSGGVPGAIKDAAGHTVRIDGNDTQNWISGSNNRVVTLPVDESGWMHRSMTDGTSTWLFNRDDQDRLTSAVVPGAGTSTYEYTSDLQLSKLIEPDGNETRFEWDWTSKGAAVVTKVIHVLDPSDPTNPTKNPTTTYNYDFPNHKTVVTDAAGNATVTPTDDGQTTYTYDKNLVVTSANPGSSALPDAPQWSNADQLWDTTRPAADPSGAWHDLQDGYDDGQGQQSVTLGATDARSGVRRVAIEEVGQGELASARSSCPGISDPPASCPSPVGPSVSFDTGGFSEGAHHFREIVQDLAGNTARSASWTVNIDRTGAGWHGDIQAHAYVDAGSSEATVTWAAASDPNLADGTDGSGTNGYAVRYRVNGGAWSAWTTTDAASTTVPGVQEDQDIDLEVTATDRVGNVGAVTAGHATVTGSTPVSGSSRLGLERFWDFDSVDTGAGSKLLVNSETGNVIWHDVPIVNPGRGLSTFVSLDYNSLERRGALGITEDVDPLKTIPLIDRPQYDVAGRGISISISGPTRINEPLGGVAAADVRDQLLGTVGDLPADWGNDIRLTDADGTTHHFLRDPDNSAKWISPPGVHLTLRRFSTTGDVVADPAWVMTRPDGVAYFFNRLGYQVRTEDRNGNRLTYTYDKSDLLTGANGPGASACAAAGMVGNASGTPSSANKWGVRGLLKAAGGIAGGKVCSLRLISVTDAAGRALTLTYKPRSSTDQSRLDSKLQETIDAPGNESIDVEGLLQQTSDRLDQSATSDEERLGPLMRPARLATITDHAGRQLTFEYDHDHLIALTEVANADALAPSGDRPRRWAFDYAPPDDRDSARRLRTITEVRDAGEGGDRTTTIDYQTRAGAPPSGQKAAIVPATITDRRGKVTTYAFSDYGASPRRMTVTDARGKQWLHDVDGFGRPLQLTDPLGDRTELKWDTGSPRRNDLLRLAEGVTATDPGSVTTMTYEPVSGRLRTQTTYPDGEGSPGTARTTELTYAMSAGQPALRPVNDPADDFVADLTEIKQPRVLPSGAHVGWKLTVDTATGDVTAREDQDGGPAATTDYCDGTDCPKGLVKRETDEVGNVTTYADFDDNGLPQTVVDPKGNPIAAGFPVPAGHDGAAADHRWLYRYDSVGNLLSVSDPRNLDARQSPTVAAPTDDFTTKFTYDAFDRAMTQVTPKDSSAGQYVTQRWTYDRNDNLLTEENAGTGKLTTYAYTTTDQPATVTQRAWSRTSAGYASRDETTTFHYDDTDLLVGRTDPRGAASLPATVTSLHLPFTTEWVRDAAGRVVAEVRHAPGETPDRKIHSLALDGRGNVLGEIDAKRNADPNGDGSNADARDADAAVSAAASAISSGDVTALRFVRVFDHADELTRSTERPAATDANSTPQIDEYDYDVDGNVVTHRRPRHFNDRPAGFSGAVADTYVYDHRDQLVQTADPLGARTVLQRRADGQVVSRTTPRGVTDGSGTSTPYTYFTESYAYDAAGDLLTRSIPYAPGQYGRSDSEFADWKVKYTRNTVGDATSIEDPRHQVIHNTFLDTGALKSTTRPSWWQLDWGNGDVPVDGPQLAEREQPLTDSADPEAGHPTTAEAGKFGKVDPVDPPDWLPRAGTTTFGYDDDGRLTSVIDAAGTRSRIDYDPAGRVVGTTQPFDVGAGADRSQDPAPQSDGTFAPGQRVVAQRYDYDLDGNLVTQSQLGRASWHTDSTYDGFDRMASSQAPGAADTPDGSITPELTKLFYDLNDNVVRVETPRGASYANVATYDSLDRVLSQTDPAGAKTSFRYDAGDNVVTRVSPRGNTGASENLDFATLGSFDAADRLVEEQGPVVDNNGTPTRFTTNYEYYADGTLKQKREPGARRDLAGGDLRRVTDYDYDGRGHVARRTQRGMLNTGEFASEARTWMWEYDPVGNLRRIVNPDGVDTASGLVDGLPTKPKQIDDYASTGGSDANIASATVGATIRQYATDDPAGDAGLATAIWLPRKDTADDRIVQRYNYDTPSLSGGDPLPTLGRLTTAYVAAKDSDATSAISRSTFGYFANGWIKSAADDHEANQGQTRSIAYDYDEQGNQMLWRTRRKDTDTSGGKVTRAFWPNGLLRTRTGRKFTYDSSGAEIDDPSPRTYKYAYNPNHSLTQLLDVEKSRTTSITRDAAERQRGVNELWASGKDSWFDYDPDGNVVARKTNGHLTDAASGAMEDLGSVHRTYAQFEYDNADRETTSATWEPTDVSPAPTVADCHLGGSAGSGTRCVRSTYHPSGERETRRMANDTVLTTLYDAFGEQSTRRREAHSGDVDTTTYTYDARGNRTHDERGGYDYNARDQLTAWKREYQSTGVDRVVHYALSPTGSIQEVTDNHDPANGDDNTTLTYTYSGERLERVTGSVSLSGVPPITNDYCYNDFQSVIAIHQRDAGETGSWCADHPADKGALDATACTSTTMPTVGSTSYCYDEFDRLLLSREKRTANGTASSKEVRSAYDALDRRDSKTVSKDSGTPVVHDLSYVGTSPLVSREVADDGGVNTFDYDSGGEQLSEQMKAPTASSYHTRVLAKDANGSVTGLEQPNGHIDPNDQYHYTPFGDLEKSSETDDPEADLSEDAQQNPFRFDGFYYDAAVKTYDMRARSYRPDDGRFLQQDIYESAQADLNLVADPLTQSRYAFAGGNPINNIELDGHCADTGQDRGPCQTYGRSPTKREKKVQSRINQQHTAANAGGYQQYYAATGYDERTGTFANPDPYGAGSNDQSFFGFVLSRAKHVLNADVDTAKNALHVAEGVTDFHVQVDCSGYQPGQPQSSCWHTYFGSGSAKDQLTGLAMTLLPEGRLARGLGKLPAGERAIIRGQRAAKGERRLYRAVSRDEADDIKATGAFGPSPTGSEAKYFYGSRKDAVRFARAMRDKGYDYDRITSGVFDEDLLGRLGRPLLTGVERGESFTVPNQLLSQIRRPRVHWRRP